MKYVRYFIILLSVLVINSSLFSQIDTLSIEDSLLTEEHLETLSEQTTEDSPIFDFLSKDVMSSKIHFRSRVSKQLQTAIAFRDSIYRGSPLKLYDRLKIQYGDHLSGGILTEKDAGERRFADFISGNITLSNYQILSKLIIGDYYVESGQGVILWRPYDISKGADVILPSRRKGIGIRPYSSSGENEFFRGAAVNLDLGNLSAALFYSRRFKSASVDSLSNITSFYTLGYFRTESEENKRNNVSEKLFGARSLYSFSNQNKVGITWYKTTFSNPLYLFNDYNYTSKIFQYLSMDYEFSFLNLSLFGEWAKYNSHLAAISGIFINPIKDLKIITSFRYYPYDFVNLHGLPFGERSENEKGFYIGVDVKPLQFLSLNTYYDLFSFPVNKSTLFSSNGHDIFAQINFRFIEKTNIIFRIHSKSTIQSFVIKDEQGFTKKVNGFWIKNNYRFNIDHRISRNIIFRERYELLFLEKEYGNNEKGSIYYSDLVFLPTKELWLNLRVAFFRTDSYSSGIYEYERDLDGVFTQPVLYGKGVCWYLIIKYTFLEHLNLSAKFSDHIRDDVKKIGSGYDQLPTNHDDRISLQLDWRL